LKTEGTEREKKGGAEDGDHCAAQEHGLHAVGEVLVDHPAGDDAPNNVGQRAAEAHVPDEGVLVVGALQGGVEETRPPHIRPGTPGVDEAEEDEGPVPRHGVDVLHHPEGAFAVLDEDLLHRQTVVLGVGGGAEVHEEGAGRGGRRGRRPAREVGEGKEQQELTGGQSVEKRWDAAEGVDGKGDDQERQCVAQVVGQDGGGGGTG